MAMGFCVELSTFTYESYNCYQSIKITVVKRKTLSSLLSTEFSGVTREKKQRLFNTLKTSVKFPLTCIKI